MKITRDGVGNYLRWNPSGTELFFHGPEGRSIWSIKVKPGVGVEGEPMKLFDLPDTVDDHMFDVADDERFLMRQVVRGTSLGNPNAVIVENWIQEFTKR